MKNEAKLTESDLEDVTFLLEDLLKRLPKLKLSQRIDIAARLRTAGKHIEAIDKSVKDEIKERRQGVEGIVNGERWRAHLTLISVNRLNQGKLKEEQPVIYAKYTEPKNDQRINWEPRS